MIAGGVDIAGKKVYWIDAKGFFGSDMDNVKTPLIRQTSKYVFVPFRVFVCGRRFFKCLRL